MKYSVFSLLLFLCVSITGISQTFQFGATDTSKTEFGSIIGSIDDQYYVWTTIPEGSKMSPGIGILNSDLDLVLTKKIELGEKKQAHDLIDVVIHKGNLLLLTGKAVNREATHYYYFTRLNPATLEPLTSVKNLGSENMHFEHYQGGCTVLNSPNALAVKLNTNFINEGREGMKMFLYTEKNTFQPFEYTFEYKDANFKVLQAYCNSRDSIYIVGLESVPEKQSNGSVAFNRYTHIMKLSRDGEKLMDVSVDFGEDEIKQFRMIFDVPGQIGFGGFYGDPRFYSQAGCFNVIVNEGTQEVVRFEKEDFPDNFVLSSYTEAQKIKVLQKFRYDREPVAMKDYILDHAFIHSDQGMVLIAECYYWDTKGSEYRGSEDKKSKGKKVVTTFYHYKDLLVIKFKKNGEVDWMQKIPKLQVSKNDYGFYCSYAMLKGKDKIHFYYLDDAENKSKSISGEMKSFRMDGRTHLTHATIDFDGKITRETHNFGLYEVKLRLKLFAQVDESKLIISWVKQDQTRFGYLIQ